MYGFDDLAVEDEEKRRPLVADRPIELEQYFGAPFAAGHAFHLKRPWRVAVGRLGMRLKAQPAQNGKSNCSEMLRYRDGVHREDETGKIGAAWPAHSQLEGIELIPGRARGASAVIPEGNNSYPSERSAAPDGSA